MSQFKTYAAYYDLLYQDKDYPSETKFVHQMLKKYATKPVKKILSLGSGTATYEVLLAQKGYQIEGLDLSPEMVKIGQQKVKKAGLNSKIHLQQADIRNFSLSEQYDAALSLFNVMGYQIKNEDMAKVLARVHAALKPGSLFAFDCWYLPAVLKDKPTDRVRIIANKDQRLIRLTSSSLLSHQDTIKISFHILSLNGQKVVAETVEDHYMRYWSLLSLEYFLKVAGFKLITVTPFAKTNSVISDNEWNIFVIAAKV